MKLLNAVAIVATLGLANVAGAQTQPRESLEREATSSDASTPGLDAKWVSGIVGMKVESRDGATLGTVRDVVVDGYGQATHAVVAYGGMMGLGNKYTAVPWAIVAEVLDRDRLIMDQSRLENAPTLSGARPDSANTTWRRTAASYWRGKVAMGPASVAAPAGPVASVTAPSSPKQK